jgi:hypothetical protein
MSDDLKNILSDNTDDAGQEKLQQYLNQQLSEKEQHDFESSLIDDEFMSDAMDGLSQMNNKADLTGIVNDLNSGLKKQLAKNKNRRNRRTLKQDALVYYTVVILLVLIVIAFVVIRMANKVG